MDFGLNLPLAFIIRNIVSRNLTTLVRIESAPERKIRTLNTNWLAHDILLIWFILNFTHSAR